MKIAWTLTLLALGSGWAVAQDKMAETLRKAVVEEESQHNLQAAVADYQQVVAQFDDGRMTAATALFRLAECQRQLHHNDQAKAAYQRVVQEFGDQSKLADQSRAVLAKTYQVTGPKAAAAVAAAIDKEHDAAKQRYRELLQEEIVLAQKQIEQAMGRVALGVIGPEDVDGPKLNLLRLKRELAAFDMGIMPSQGK